MSIALTSDDKYPLYEASYLIKIAKSNELMTSFFITKDAVNERSLI